jgi:pimeloyl-ACP methyl ester carboxylesterase
VPLLIIAGEEDKIAPLSGCEAILRAYGTIEKDKLLEFLDGVGHWHCVEDPDSVGQKISSFISGIQKQISKAVNLCLPER